MPYFQPEQRRDVDVEQRQRGLFDEFAVRQNSSQCQPVFCGVINLHVVVAWIDHPQPRNSEVFVDRLFCHRIHAVISSIHDFSQQPRLVGCHGHQGEIRTHQRARRQLDWRTRGEQLRGGMVEQARRDERMKPRANGLVTSSGRPAHDRFALKNFLVEFAHECASILRRNRPVCERALRATISGVPSTTMLPPPSPPSGPRSMIQSASAIRSRLCSITMTECPASTSRCNTSTSRRTSAMCRPIVGSSRMNRLCRAMGSNKLRGSFSPLNKWVTSFTRCASPPLNVGLVCPSLR